MKLNRKNKLLIFGFIISLYICYVFAFSNTKDYYDQYKKQNEIFSSAINNPHILDKLLKKEQQLDNGLKQFTSASGSSFQNELLTELARLSNKYNLKIQSFNEPHTVVENNMLVSSYVFSFNGSFNSVLLLLSNIENNPKFGFVKHVSFIKKRDYKSNSDYLISEIILQKHETIEDKNPLASEELKH